jgi:Ca2+-binding RTX toxin-like protein
LIGRRLFCVWSETRLRLFCIHSDAASDAAGIQIEGTRSMAQFNGTSAADRLVGGAEGDLLLGLAGNDRLDGGAGNDTLNGAAGDDAVIGGAGVDTCVLNIGRGGFVVTSPSEGVFVLRPSPGGLGSAIGTDTVSGVEFFQIVSSNTTQTVAASDMMARFNFGYSHSATSGNDKLLGGAGSDSINGGGGADTIEGGDGADRLAGGSGADVLRGGAGADVFVFRAGEGDRDRVEDFVVGVDHLELHAASGYQPRAVEGTDASGKAGTWVSWGWNTDTVFLSGVTGVGLDALLV